MTISNPDFFLVVLWSTSEWPLDEFPIFYFKFSKNRCGRRLCRTLLRKGGILIRLNLAVLEERRLLLQTIVRAKKKALTKTPAGRLKIAHKKKRAEYYWVNSDTGRSKYITLPNMRFAAALAQKAYDQVILRYAAKELRVLDQLIKNYRKENIDLVYEALSKERQLLVNPIWPSDEEFLAEWRKQESCLGTFDDDFPEFYTKNNERVRSKSEILIANEMFDYNVPYLFECKINLIGLGSVLPDFSVLDIKTRKTIIWEHLGRMDDPSYVERNLRRINAYLKNGYVIGETLILTFETHDQPISTVIIDMIIKHYFL